MRGTGGISAGFIGRFLPLSFLMEGGGGTTSPRTKSGPGDQGEAGRDNEEGRGDLPGSHFPGLFAGVEELIIDLIELVMDPLEVRNGLGPASGTGDKEHGAQKGQSQPHEGTTEE